MYTIVTPVAAAPAIDARVRITSVLSAQGAMALTVYVVAGVPVLNAVKPPVFDLVIEAVFASSESVTLTVVFVTLSALTIVGKVLSNVTPEPDVRVETTSSDLPPISFAVIVKGKSPSVSPSARVIAAVHDFASPHMVTVAALPPIVTTGVLMYSEPTIVRVATSPTFASVVVLLLLAIVAVVIVPALASSVVA